MKSKTLVLVVVALVCGIGAAYMTSRLIAERSETVSVLVAKQKYGPWTMIKDPTTMFEEREIPKGEAPKTAVVRIEDLKDRILLRTLPSGQPVVAEDLQDKNKNSMETQITPGMRAIAIKTDAPSTVGGFVLPGSHVDVYHAMNVGGVEHSRLVLQNILVRAVDLTNIRPEDKPGLVPTTVTLEVTPEQALQLVSIKDTGNLTLALRSAGDTAELKNDPRNKPAPPVKPTTPVVKATAVVVKKKAPEKHYMEIYNGSARKPYLLTTQDGVTSVEVAEKLPDTTAVQPSVQDRPVSGPVRSTVPAGPARPAFNPFSTKQPA